MFSLNCSIETKIKTLFLIFYFNLSKKRNGTLGTRILLAHFEKENSIFITFSEEQFRKKDAHFA